MDSRIRVGHNLSMDEPRTFRLRYVGARFAEHHLPVDVLSDLPAFRDLLVAYVKTAWREAHPDRVRLPRGFIRGLQFDLVNIEDGSAIPALEWDSGSAQLQLPDMKDEIGLLVGQASERVARLFAGAASVDGTAALSTDELNALNRFGNSLREDERIEFLGHEDGDGNVIYLDAFRRKRLITRETGTYPVRFDSVGRLLGSVIDADESNGRITINTDEHGTFELRVPPERAANEFDGKMKNDVQFRLVIELDENDTFRGVVEVLEIELIDDQVLADMDNCRNRIAALSSLVDGWHDGSGKSPTLAATNAGYALLARNPGMASHYRIFPTEAGGLLFEFARAGWDYSVEISPDGQAEIYGVEDGHAGEMETGSLDFEGPEFRLRFDRVTGGRS